MNKYTLLGLVLISTTASFPVVHANQILFPSLEETFRQNEQRILSTYEERISGVITSHSTEGSGATLPEVTLSGSTSDNTPTTSMHYLTNEPVGFVKQLTYTPISTGKAVSLFRANEENLWMQEVRLDQGATVESILVADGFDPIEDGGEPLFAKMTLDEMTGQTQNSPFSIVNGQFFDPRATPTRLSFGLKMNGEIRTVGADNGTRIKNILIINRHGAEIKPYKSWEDLRDADADFAMVNFSLVQPHYRNANIGRTYMCIKNPNETNQGNTLLVFTAESMNERNMENELIRQGCTYASSTKLDSSGSTRLWHQGISHYGFNHKGAPDKRRIPHGIAIIDAK